MKKLLLLVVAGFALATCSKKNDPTPAGPATAITGNYTVSAFLFLNTSDTLYLPQLPLTDQNVTISGTLDITPVRNSTTFVDMLITLRETGYTDNTLPIDSVEVRQTGSSYGLYLGTLPLGTADGTSVNFDVANTSPAFRLAFKAKK